MKTKIETQADMLKALISEDRQEIRGIRASVYNLTVLLATASFAITAFLIGREYYRTNWLCLVTDVLIILFIWLLVARLKHDLYACRQCLFARQALIRALDQDDPKDLDPFPDARTMKPDIRDSELWWVPVIAMVAIGLKSILVWFLR